MAGAQLRIATLAVLIGCAAQIAPAQEVITKQYDDGGLYKGTFTDGKQDGYGSYKLPSGYEYEGQ